MMTPEELAEFKRLLGLYLAMTCAYCGSTMIENRHILTCTGCGVVFSDLRAVVDTSEPICHLCYEPERHTVEEA